MWMTMLLAGLGGAAVGLVVGLVGRLTRGAYPLIDKITDSPYKSALLGAFVGIMIVSWHGFLRSPRRVDTAGPVTQITSAEQFRADVLGAARPVVVDFFATWCGPCKMLSPVLENLAWDYAGRVSFVKVDVDQLGELARQYNVQGVPTVVLIGGGQEVHRWVGVQPAEEYRKVLGTVELGAKEEPAMTQPTTSVTMKGRPVVLVGHAVAVGDAAPDFVAVDTDLKEVSLREFRGKVVLLLSVPSLDTAVCSRETHRFNEAASGLGSDVVILVVSMDLPFAQKRWCGAEGVTSVRTLSDHRQAAFGRAYGVLIGDLRLLARAVFVVGRDGTLRYKELVGEVSSEPDYGAALRAAAAAVKA